MKKTFAFLLAGVMSLSLLAGCGAEQAPSEEAAPSEGASTEAPAEGKDMIALITMEIGRASCRERV